MFAHGPADSGTVMGTGEAFPYAKQKQLQRSTYKDTGIHFHKNTGVNSLSDLGTRHESDIDFA